MRILLLDHYYEGFVRDNYSRHPGLKHASFDDQSKSFAAELFGETAFQVDALGSLGHEVLFLPVNVPHIINAWAREHGLRTPRRSSMRFARPSGRLVRPVRADRPSWLGDALEAIAGRFQPDIVHVGCLEAIEPEILTRLRQPQRLIVGQSASPVVPWAELGRLDLFISSLPNYVERAATSVRSAYLPLAFEPTLATNGQGPTRDLAVTFIGSLGGAHAQRLDLLAAVARRQSMDIWSPDFDAIGPDRSASIRVHGPAWGRTMYDLLGRSAISINIHGRHAAGYANNLRLFEVTGMGALLVTEEAPNLDSLFEPGEEVIAYGNANELVDVIGYYVEHREVAAAIAARGRERTLRDHTWRRRMSTYLEIVGSLERPAA